MADEFDLKPVTHLTTDAIGPPGQRVFYVQGQQEARTVTLIAEKFQIQSLSVGVEQFLAELQEKHPEMMEASPDYAEETMRINPPVDPLFRIGELALGYDAEEDMAILVTREVVVEETADEESIDVDPVEVEPGPSRAVRFWCSRSQLRALAHWGLEVASRGRPLCPQCGAPIDPEEGHFCPKKNGHRG
jgi:uncharacterized repeat protein (TIGR03847 family)